MDEDIIEDLSMASPEDPWFWIKVSAGMVVLCMAVVLWVVRLKRAGRLPFQTPPVEPGRSALDRLAAILHLIDEGLVREFVGKASDIVRGFIEIRFGLRAPKLSTEEFLFEAERSERLDATARALLADFLFRCDRVKFALGDLDRPQMVALYNAAAEFIEQSTSASEADAQS